MSTSAHSGFVKTSDFLLVAVLVIGGIFEYFFPSSLTMILDGFKFYIGFLFLIFGWILILFTKYELKRFAQPSRPGIPTEVLVTSGIFKYSRNPIYVGILLICIAISLFFDSIWILSMTVPLFFLLTYILIIPEEHYLSSKFKDEFSKYKKDVRRWM